MTCRERIERQMAGQKIDRLPVLGGWLTTAFQYQTFAECSEAEFWADPHAMGVRAYRNLGVDGIMGMFLPTTPDDFRGGVTAESVLQRSENYPTAEAVLAYVQDLPAPERLADEFDAQDCYDGTLRWLQPEQATYGEMVNMPPRWDADGNFMWYGTFGFDSYLGALGQYPDEMTKLFECAAETSRLQNQVVAQAYTDHDFCKLLLMGQDICGQTGPMVSPKWLKRVYFPLAKRAVQPLLDAGFKLIWHSDGNILPILDLVLDLGVAGFQGFQWETGATVDIVAKHKTTRGEPLLFMGGYSATITLVNGTPDDVRLEIEHYREVTEDRLFLFSTTSINPDAKIENIRAAFHYAQEHPFV